jgi:hypothetical protein
MLLSVPLLNLVYPRLLMDWLIMMEWGYVSELRPRTGLLFIPGWYVSMESHGDHDAGWVNSWLVHQSSLAVQPAEYLRQVGGMDE